jgi:GNAT superfamily N-acetyltransferase
MTMTVRRALSGDLEPLLPLVRAYRRFYGQEPDEFGERLEDLFVHPAQRNRGNAGRLMNAAVASARESGAAMVLPDGGGSQARAEPVCASRLAA